MLGKDVVNLELTQTNKSLFILNVFYIGLIKVRM